MLINSWRCSITKGKIGREESRKDKLNFQTDLIYLAQKKQELKRG